MNKKDNSSKNNGGDKNLWDELAKSINMSHLHQGHKGQEKIESELLEAALSAKQLFDAFLEAGFSDVYALRLIAEIMLGGSAK